MKRSEMKRRYVFAFCCAVLALQLSGQEPSPAEQLVRMVAKGDLAGVKSLLSTGADPNVVDNSNVHGWTALMEAARQGTVDLARELIRAHVNVSARNQYGATALDIAEINSHWEVASVIRSAGGTGRPKDPEPKNTDPISRPPTARTSNESIANVKAGIQEPRIALRFPGLECEASVTTTSHDYRRGTLLTSEDRGTVKVVAEQVTIILRQRGEIRAKGDWVANLPLFTTHDLPSYSPADVRAEDLFVELLHAGAFTQEDLAQLVFSKLVEVRIGAVANLDDQALLARIASSDDHPVTRETAVKKIRNQTVLASIASDDASPLVREAVVWRLEDQGALAKLARADGDSRVRSSAGARLLRLQTSDIQGVTDQELLAKFATEDPDARIREVAASKLVDLGALLRVATTDPDPAVRKAATNNLKYK